MLLLDGEGGIGKGTILEITSGSTAIEVGEVSRVEEERPRMHLYQALPRGAKMDAVVQQAVELGAAAVAPFASERSHVLDEAARKRTGRWRKLALASSRVAGRPFLPRVLEARSWEDALRDISAMEAALFADEAGGERPGEALAGIVPGELGLVIGPEGGFSDGERAALAGAGARPVTLGGTVLRAETAGMVLLAAARCRYGLL